MRVNSRSHPESHNNANAIVSTRGRDAKSIRLPSPAGSSGLSPPVDITRRSYTALERSEVCRQHSPLLTREGEQSGASREGRAERRELVGVQGSPTIQGWLANRSSEVTRDSPPWPLCGFGGRPSPGRGG